MIYKIIIVFNFFIFLFFSNNILSLDNQYKLKILKSELSSPWSLTFVNNNQILISEKNYLDCCFKFVVLC